MKLQAFLRGSSGKDLNLAWVRTLVFTGLLWACAGANIAQESTVKEGGADLAEGWSSGEKIAALNIGAAIAVAGWGAVHWDYGERSAHASSERWFQKDTKHGGADKVGHMYTGYVLSHAFASAYEGWGAPRDHAALQGAASSFLITGLIEFGDSFSRYGFSYEDMIANTCGSALGWWIWLDPDVASKVDFRVEYDFRFQQSDVVTDYEHLKYFLAFKADGFEMLKETPLRYFELHTGYFTRGYSDEAMAHGDDLERRVFVGISINLTSLFSNYDLKAPATLLRYLQPPYTTASLSHDLN
jgi:Predicted periplasmic lipoprotein (DUF2279)